MQTTLKDLFEREIFESYEILSGKDYLNRSFHSISILETPDFENYIIEESLILTTFYPVKSEIETFKHLLFALNKKNTAGIMIKMNRYIDIIPSEIIELANQLNLPIVALNYDANLSSLFNNILVELQSQDYSNYSFDANYSQFLKQINDHPSTKTLLDIVEKIPDLDMLVQNLDTKVIHYSSEIMNDYFIQSKSTKHLFQRVGDTLYYSEDVIYDDTPIYHIILKANNEKRHILHNYIEIFKLMIIVIHQKKIENTLKQNQFLLNFISNISSNLTNTQLIESSKRYNWSINFPVTLILFSIKNDKRSDINPNVVEYIKTVIINKFHLNSEELRFSMMNEQLFFILNTMESVDIAQTMHYVYETLQAKYKQMVLKVTYSNLIREASQISRTYSQLSEALLHIENRNLNINLFSEDNIKLLNLLKNIDYTHLMDYTNNVLSALIAYEKKNNVPLIDTLYKFIECKFNTKNTADALFIHYNSVRYRLDVINQLGINVTGNVTGHFDLYFALYLYKNFDHYTK
ncbi:MAG: PucR family transcriptional regulator [Acholeplasmataceae bacterium]|nr:PucR family transcriptional regulator [Acholeplasmataceae bacterium]